MRKTTVKKLREFVNTQYEKYEPEKRALIYKELKRRWKNLPWDKRKLFN